jgi:hypothetical protein
VTIETHLISLSLLPSQRSYSSQRQPVEIKAPVIPESIDGRPLLFTLKRTYSSLCPSRNVPLLFLRRDARPKIFVSAAYGQKSDAEAAKN